MRTPEPLIIVLFVLTFAFIVPGVPAYSLDAESSFANGLNLINTSNYTEAVSAFDEALALEPSYYEALNGKADALNRNGNYSGALGASNESLAINGSYAEGWINRGYILYNLGWYDEELDAYDKAISIDPKNANAWFNRGYALAARGKYDAALQAFDKVGAIDPGYPYLEGNRKTVETYRDATLPFYIKYGTWILIFGAAIVVIGVWLYGLKKKR
jgi:tetratricopeptide (TPR) repeat protein